MCDIGHGNGPIVLLHSSIFLRDCSQCRVMVACQQFRSRDCKKMDILLHCASQPVIESCTKLKFGCFMASYPQLEGWSYIHLKFCLLPNINLSYSSIYGQLIVDQFKSAGISLVSNNWSDVYDFTKVPDEINWSLLDHVSLLLNHMLSRNIYYC